MNLRFHKRSSHDFGLRPNSLLRAFWPVPLHTIYLLRRRGHREELNQTLGNGIVVATVFTQRKWVAPMKALRGIHLEQARSRIIWKRTVPVFGLHKKERSPTSSLVDCDAANSGAYNDQLSGPHFEGCFLRRENHYTSQCVHNDFKTVSSNWSLRFIMILNTEEQVSVFACVDSWMYVIYSGA